MTPDGGRLFNQFAVADKMGKSLEEVRSLSETEFVGWLAFYSAKHDLLKG